VAEEESNAWDTIARLLAHARELRVFTQLWLSERGEVIIRNDPGIRRIQDETLDLLDGLVTTAQHDGRLRADIGSGDVTMMLSLLVKYGPTADKNLADMMLHRATVLILDGLRAPGTLLPGGPVTHRDLS